MLHTLVEHAKEQPIEPQRPRPARRRVKPPQEPAPPLVQDRHLLDVVRVLYRRKRMILTVAFLGAILATAVGLAVPPRYTAIAEIAVEPPQRSSSGGPAQAAEEVMIIDTHIATLSSRDQMTRVLDSLTPAAGTSTERPSAGSGGLADPASSQGDGLSLTELTSRLRMWTGLGAERGMGMTLEQLENSSKIMQARRSRLISVVFTAKSPEQAAALANRIAEFYVDGQYEQKRASLNEALARVGERIAELKDEAESLRSAAQVLTVLLRRQDQLRSEIEFISADVRIASLAKPPERPSSSNPLLFIFPAALICAIGASSFAVIRDRLDRSLRSEREVSDALGVPCIGLVPKAARMSPTHRYRHLLTEPFSAYAEAIRSAAATLRIVAKPRSSKVVLISSSVPMEGKSTLALSLATYVSSLGRRVLLIDLDFRKRSFLAELLSGRREAGLQGLQVQDLPPEQSIQHIPELGLDYLPVQRHRVDPLLLAGEQMPRLLRQVRDSYDCVIIDGPPLLGAAEARLLPAVADKVLFVVKWGETTREIAQSALRLLRDAGYLGRDSGDLPTAILTQVDVEQHARYRFGDAGELMLKYRRYYSRARRAWRSAAATPAAAAPQEKAAAPAAGSVRGDRHPVNSPDNPAAMAAE